MKSSIRLPALAALIAAAIMAGEARAQGSGGGQVQAAPSTEIVSKVFSQLVSYRLPPGFAPAFVDRGKGSYIQESVPAGETVEKWTQMITLAANEDLALNSAVTPILYTDQMAKGYRAACPETFAAQGLGNMQVDGYDSFVAYLGCGSIKPGNTYGESMIVIVIKGTRDYYSLQWAERAPPVRKPQTFDQAKWMDRLAKLRTIRLCGVKPGETAPYAGCSGRN